METRTYNYNKVSSKIVKETPKAFQLNILYWTKAEDKEKSCTIWCPKSCCKVENEEVVEVADFILNNWVKEHMNYIRQYRHTSNINISFDMEEKSRLKKFLEDKRNKEQEEYQNLIDKVYNYTKPFADAFMQEIGLVLKAWGTYINNNDFIELSKRIVKDFGECKKYTSEEIEEFLSRAKRDNWGLKEMGETLNYYFYDTWIFGDFHMNSNWDHSKEEKEGGFTRDQFYNVYGLGGFSLSYPIPLKFKKNHEYLMEGRKLYSDFYHKCEENQGS